MSDKDAAPRSRSHRGQWPSHSPSLRRRDRHHRRRPRLLCGAGAVGRAGRVSPASAAAPGRSRRGRRWRCSGRSTATRRRARTRRSSGCRRSPRCRRRPRGPWPAGPAGPAGSRRCSRPRRSPSRTSPSRRSPSPTPEDPEFAELSVLPVFFEHDGQALMPCSALTRSATWICSERLASSGEPEPPKAFQVESVNCRPPPNPLPVFVLQSPLLSHCASSSQSVSADARPVLRASGAAAIAPTRTTWAARRVKARVSDSSVFRSMTSLRTAPRGRDHTGGVDGRFHAASPPAGAKHPRSHVLAPVRSATFVPGQPRPLDGHPARRPRGCQAPAHTSPARRREPCPNGTEHSASFKPTSCERGHVADIVP